MECRLLGGGLDGRVLELCEHEITEKLSFRNPSSVQYHSQQHGTITLRHLIYKRSHVSNRIVYYQFHGYDE